MVILTKFHIFSLLIVAIAHESIGSSEEESEEVSDHDWDVLIFTQQWPVTYCYQWMEEGKNHTCNLPKQKDSWTIHGIWPTRFGQVGPNFCNQSANFDLHKLYPIFDDLLQFWPDIETGTKVDYLWEHEWLKHGTCAAKLRSLDSEIKYFEQGLLWRSQYLISNILGQSGIHPDSNNTVISLQLALKKMLGKNPSIHCHYDRKTDVSYLSEIRMCFDKTLQVVDCDGVPGAQVAIDYPGGKVNTNCHISKPVTYPSTVPPLLAKDEWKFPIVNLYKLVKFIMWLTL